MELKVKSPYSGALVCRLPLLDGAQVEARLKRAAEAAAPWRDTPLVVRIERVRSGIEEFRRNLESVARDITLQMGKPIAQARAEVQTMLARADHLLAAAPTSLAPVELPEANGLIRRIEHVPLGPVLTLSAWNYPLLIAVNVVVPALLAANPVLLKHSNRTPLCAEHFARAFVQLPEGVFAALTLDHAQVARLVRDERIQHVAFTGSVAGGRAVQQAARERFIDVGLELGGSDPAYVAADADVAWSAAQIVDGACYNAGQSCCAVERAYVHASRYEEFLEAARGVMAEYVAGDPLDEATTLGPMADAASVRVLARRVKAAVRAGARVAFQGTVPDERFFPPTLVADCPEGADLLTEENFGPVLPVVKVEDDAEALRQMNASRYGLTASVWTSDAARAEWFVQRLDAGTVFQNRCDFLDPGLPWTGVKDSGRGVTLSAYGFLQLTRRKSVHLRIQQG